MLVEGTSRTDPERLRGRTRHNKVVNFTGLAGARRADRRCEIARRHQPDALRRGATAGARGAVEPMRIRAAVLEEFGSPLVVQEVELAEPGPGEVLVRLVACGVCHTDMYTASGVDPSGYAPTVLGHEGAGVVERCGEDVSLVREGDHVVTLFSPQCGECVHCRQPADEPLPGDPRAAEPRLPARRHDAALARRRAAAPLHGHLDVRRVHGDAARSRSRRSIREAPLDRACLFACGLSTGLGAAMQDRRGARRARRASCSAPGMVGLGAVAGCRLQGAERIVCVDLSPERLELARGQGATDVLIGGADTVARILEMTGGFGADYTFEATGNVAVMRQAVEAARMGWGLCTVCGVAGRGETLDVVPRLLITGRRVCGSSFGGLKGRDDVPALVEPLPRRARSTSTRSSPTASRSTRSTAASS